jgi:hypothetical protein
MGLIISDTAPRVQYTAANTQTQFTIPFEFFADADIKVIKTASNGTDTTLTLASSPANATQYSVEGAGVSSGGTRRITLGGASTNGDIYTIFRELAVERTSDFPVSGNFPIETLNTELDKITAMIQQNESDNKFSPQAKSSTSTAYGLIFPELVANKILTVNSSGNALEFSQSITDVATVAGIAGDITTVSGIASNVTAVAGNATNINAVANDATDIGAVAAKATEIGRLGTADAVADMAILATDAIVADMAILGTDAVVADMAILGSDATVADMAILATNDVVADMAILATNDVVADMNTLGTSDVVSDMNTLGTSDVVSDMNTLASSSNVTNMNTLAGISSNITTVAGISSAVSAVNSNESNINAVNSNSSNINTVAGNNSNITTVAGISGNVTTVAGNNSNVTTVASNITNVNTFANQYRIGSSDPTSSLDEGDLFYNTTSNVMKFYNGSAWVAISADTDSLVKVSSNDTTAGFLNGKLVAGSNVSFTEGNNGGNETLTIASSVPDLNASKITAGTIATARLGTGTASGSTFLAGDQTYKTVSGTTINNNADNRVITGSGTANTLEGESNLTFDGSILTVTGDVLPASNNAHDLGSTSKVWRNIYTSDLNMSNEYLDKGNDVDGTKGSWTFQEGADDLFLLNNKNGKKYKFKIEECK